MKYRIYDDNDICIYETNNGISAIVFEIAINSGLSKEKAEKLSFFAYECWLKSDESFDVYRFADWASKNPDCIKLSRSQALDAFNNLDN